jgi:transposase
VAVTSDGMRFQNPGNLNAISANGLMPNATFTEKQKGSSNQNKQRFNVARLHEKIANSHLDALHMISR